MPENESVTYKIMMADGSTMELPGVTRHWSDGSGRHFDMANGHNIKFDDGETKWAVPTTTEITPAPQPEGEAE